MAEGFKQAAQAAYNFVTRKGANDMKTAPPTSAAAPDPLSPSQATRMRSLAHTRELMSRRTK